MDNEISHSRYEPKKAGTPAFFKHIYSIFEPSGARLMV